MSLLITKIEAWALQIISRVEGRFLVEDSRVELKRVWPDQEKAARQIAGHANSSFGSDVLWIVGVDESTGVVGVAPEELANWWPAVCSYFDGVAPSLTDLHLTIKGKTVVCLYFETNRPPYVVKNPVYGKPGGGPVNWEVPWREGANTRTAAHNDLVRLLIPTLSQPEIELLEGYGTFQESKSIRFGDESQYDNLSFSFKVYLYPRNEVSLVIPFHRCKCVLSDGLGNIFDKLKFSITRPHIISRHGSMPDTVTLERTNYELIAHGPGQCTIQVTAKLNNELDWFESNNIQVRLLVFVIDAELPVELSIVLKQVEPKRDEKRRWLMEPPANH